MQLNQKNLPAVGRSIKVPAYDRNEIKAGIVHVGVGGFHRAHQAVVVQQLLAAGGHKEWGICGIGLREGDRRIADIFARQDCLYTLITRYPTGEVDSEVMQQMTDFLLAPDDKQAVVDRMANPETKIVSLTITEGGYNLTADGEFDLGHPDIQHELKHPNDPKTIYGYLSAALRKRKDKQQTPFTVMSCDNIQHNGDVTRKMLLSFLSAQDEGLAAWVGEEVAFPNSMVDRITPVTTGAEMEYLKDQFDLEDEWPVTCEPFLQWIIEDNFSNGRPDFDKVDGVQFVQDVTPYEKMKIRLLNAGHSVLGICGALMGIQTINACMENEQLRTVLRKFWDEEATPILDKVEGIDLEAYKDSLQVRFSNPNIRDKVSRICSASSAKLPKFLLPTIEENLSKGGSIDMATWLIAAWCYYSDKQIDQNGQSLEIIDAMQDQLNRAAQNTTADALSFLRVREVFGSLIDNENFTSLYATTVRRFYEEPVISVQLQRW
ncbi:MAG: mannitol dehydrogenase family protein [Imperialibacter sp.]|uniref:mannitol dehydrogenase family protein n=1 Tax=Imperialibacter sp. TaxID=2038411 RepID=UPI003A8C2BC2